MYSVKEIFVTLQGEGAQVGRAAVFCRFAGCNLWSGHEEDRGDAICDFCDTDFVGTDGKGGGKFSTAFDLAKTVADKWIAKANPKAKPFVVCTGGEPLLQMDDELVEAFHSFGFEVAIETNGTRKAPKGIDWICVSPKADAEIVITEGHELKLVHPQPKAMPEKFEHLNFQHFFLQPMDGSEIEKNTKLTIDYCLAHPQWRLSLQMHKMIGIP
jgi:7-carboxy-7-deazaguanine synthase (Cx14CxxC type)